MYRINQTPEAAARVRNQAMSDAVYYATCMALADGPGFPPPPLGPGKLRLDRHLEALRRLPSYEIRLWFLNRKGYDPTALLGWLGRLDGPADEDGAKDAGELGALLGERTISRESMDRSIAQWLSKKPQLS
jgi:hypothetical protein